MKCQITVYIVTLSIYYVYIRFSEDYLRTYYFNKYIVHVFTLFYPI